MKIEEGINTFEPRSRQEWRQWLAENHLRETSVWLIVYHKNCPVPSVKYEEAVEEALCFGWIDGRTNKRNSQSSYLYFSKRKTKSTWSKSNKTRIERLIEQDLMTPAGLEIINIARQNGSWDELNDIDNLIIPEDLKDAFLGNKKARINFQAFPDYSKKIILHWIKTAKREVTRRERIKITVELAEKNIKAR